MSLIRKVSFDICFMMSSVCSMPASLFCASVSVCVCVQPCSQGFQPSTSFLLCRGAEGVWGWLCPSKLRPTPQVNVPALVCAWTLYRVAGRALTFIVHVHFISCCTIPLSLVQRGRTLPHVCIISSRLHMPFLVSGLSGTKSSFHLHAPRHPGDCNVNTSLKHQRYSGA